MFSAVMSEQLVNKARVLHLAETAGRSPLRITVARLSVDGAWEYRGGGEREHVDSEGSNKKRPAP